MGGSRSSPWCDRCGTLARFSGDMSCVGICEICGQIALVDNLWGLTDPQSVPYKNWLVKYQMSRPGRPRNTTPTPAQLNQLMSVHPKKKLPDVACMSWDEMLTIE